MGFLQRFFVLELLVGAMVLAAFLAFKGYAEPSVDPLGRGLEARFEYTLEVISFPKQSAPITDSELAPYEACWSNTPDDGRLYCSKAQ